MGSDQLSAVLGAGLSLLLIVSILNLVGLFLLLREVYRK